MKETLLAAQEENNKMIKNNNSRTERIKEDLQLLKINEEMNRKEDLQKDLIKQKVREREMNQQNAQNILAAIYQHMINKWMNIIIKLFLVEEIVIKIIKNKMNILKLIEID